MGLCLETDCKTVHYEIRDESVIIGEEGEDFPHEPEHIFLSNPAHEREAARLEIAKWFEDKAVLAFKRSADSEAQHLRDIKIAIEKRQRDGDWKDPAEIPHAFEISKEALREIVAFFSTEEGQQHLEETE